MIQKLKIIKKLFINNYQINKIPIYWDSNPNHCINFLVLFFFHPHFFFSFKLLLFFYSNNLADDLSTAPDLDFKSSEMAQKSENRFAKMERLRSHRRVQIEDSKPTRYDDDDDEEEPSSRGSIKLRPSEKNVTEDQEPFMGVKVRRRASLHRDYKGDYLDVPSQPFLMKLLGKQGERCLIWFDWFCVGLVLSRFGGGGNAGKGGNWSFDFGGGLGTGKTNNSHSMMMGVNNGSIWFCFGLILAQFDGLECRERNGIDVLVLGFSWVINW